MEDARTREKEGTGWPEEVAALSCRGREVGGGLCIKRSSSLPMIEPVRRTVGVGPVVRLACSGRGWDVVPLDFSVFGGAFCWPFARAFSLFNA